MPIPARVLELVETFDRNLEAYRSDAYNETQLRREFIDPFFGELGWDVDNKQGYAEPYKDVIHEDAIRVGGATKAPDYCFRIGGARKFFVEAKKPAVNIQESVHPAFQLRRYAWSAKLPLSILTDFEEFAVYDCRVKPVKTDSAATGRTMFLRYADYAARWDELAAIFARESVLKGSFDTYAESTRAKRGTAEVDDAFLKDIEAWRDALARNLALRNPTLTPRELNFAVQRTIDRIIFLRICEDRAVERYGRLQALLNGPQVYPRLAELFRRADERYNSGLFHFHPERDRAEAPDQLTLALTVDDKPLKQIIRSLYYPDSPYEFSVLSADILGQVYEQFLGKVIRLTAGHRAVVEDKPEVKKAGGVYYTPTYIVDYIVEHTVGTLLDGKTPKQAAKLRILDPACGSGSFLIGAYQRLLDWHRDWYVADAPAKWAGGRSPALFQAQGGDWRLTTAERRRILLNNIYGVDIDPQAVEVTKLSLLLKVLEGETEQSLSAQLRLFHERALPDLGRNIKCGNSLIGPDFYQNRQLSLLDDEERYRINVFDWTAEFPAIMKSGGFDAVIGNPPYVLLQADFRDDRQLAYFRSRFAAASFKLDTYHLFMEKAIRLTRVSGRCSLITPANYLTNNHLAPLRRLMLQLTNMEQILVIDRGVFSGISVDNSVFVAKAGGPSHDPFAVLHSTLVGDRLAQVSRISVDPVNVVKDPHLLFTGSADPRETRLWDKILKQSLLLGSIAKVNFGKQLRDRTKHPEDVRKVTDVRSIPPGYKPCYTGRDVSRYRLVWGKLACLDQEVARCGGCWDAQAQNSKGKIVTRQIGRYPEYAIDARGYQCLNTMFMVNLTLPSCNPLFVLALLNSTMNRALWKHRFYDQRRTFPKIKGTYLKKVPIFAIDLSKEEQKNRHEAIVELASEAISLRNRFSEAKTDHDQVSLQRQIDATDRQIDQLVYELYGLTEEEIRIVEEGTAGDFGFSPCAGQRAQAGGQQAR